MRAARMFDEFIKTGTVKRQSPDKSRAEFLRTESEKDHSFLQELIAKMGINDSSANSIIKSCYDILMELIRSKMLLDGLNASGQGAHEAEVAYMRILGFRETEVQFANQLRFFRNGMLYYGTILDKEYAEKVVDFTKKVYPKLKSMQSQEKRV